MDRQCKFSGRDHSAEKHSGDIKILCIDGCTVVTCMKKSIEENSGKCRIMREISSSLLSNSELGHNDDEEAAENDLPKAETRHTSETYATPSGAYPGGMWRAKSQKTFKGAKSLLKSYSSLPVQLVSPLIRGVTSLR